MCFFMYRAFSPLANKIRHFCTNNSKSRRVSLSFDTKFVATGAKQLKIFMKINVSSMITSECETSV